MLVVEEGRENNLFLCIGAGAAVVVHLQSVFSFLRAQKRNKKRQQEMITAHSLRRSLIGL